MDRSEIEFLYDYNRWANARIFNGAGTVTEAQLHKNLSTSFGSLHGTLLHIVGAEWIWLERWRGVSPPQLLTDLPTLEILRKKLSEIEEGQKAFLAGLSQDSLARELSYKNTKGETWSYPLVRMLQHVVNHSSYHRGQVTAQLRQLGARGVATDLLLYLDQGSP